MTTRASIASFNATTSHRKLKPMTADDFIAWRAHLGISGAEAARRLGVSKNMPAAYEKGRPIPLYVALACAALAFGLPPWRAA